MELEDISALQHQIKRTFIIKKEGYSIGSQTLQPQFSLFKIITGKQIRDTIDDISALQHQIKRTFIIKKEGYSVGSETIRLAVGMRRDIKIRMMLQPQFSPFKIITGKEIRDTLDDISALQHQIKLTFIIKEEGYSIGSQTLQPQFSLFKIIKKKETRGSRGHFSVTTPNTT